MDMQKILAVFTSLQNNNLTATPPTSLVEDSFKPGDKVYHRNLKLNGTVIEPPFLGNGAGATLVSFEDGEDREVSDHFLVKLNEDKSSPYKCKRCYDTGNIDCSWCNGTGNLGDNSYKVSCRHCKAGQVPCRCQSDEILKESMELKAEKLADSILNGKIDLAILGMDEQQAYKLAHSIKNGSIDLAVLADNFPKIFKTVNEAKYKIKCSFCDDNKYVPEPILSKYLEKNESGCRAVPCPYCNKNGKQIRDEKGNPIREAKEVICKNCSADGVIPCQACNGKAGNEKCKECYGEGEMTCTSCKGKGYVGDKNVNKVNECETVTGTMTSEAPSNLTINTTYDAVQNRKTISVTADNERAEELAHILKLSGIIPNKSTQDTGEVIEKDNFYGLREDISFYDLDERDLDIDEADSAPKGYCVCCQEPIENDGIKESGLCFDCFDAISDKIEADAFENDYREPDDFEEYNRNEADDYRDEFNESKLNEAKEYYVEIVNSDGEEYLKMNGRTKSFVDNKNEATKFSDQAEAKSKAAELKLNGKEVRVLPILESLSPKRENSGLNGAARGWANSPNEQISGWKALIDDADGPNKPKEAYPNRLGDNPIKVAANKKDEQLHENKNINAIAEKLSNKFAKLNENEAAYAAKQLNFKHVVGKLLEAGFIHNPEKEAEINHSAHIFTGENDTFITVSKDGKWDWAYHCDEELSEGEGKASLLILLDNLNTASDGDLMDEYNSAEWEPEPRYPYDDLEDEVTFLESKKSDKKKVLDWALEDNEKTGKMQDDLDKEDNSFSKAAKRLGKVSKDYKPVGTPVRKK